MPQEGKPLSALPAPPASDPALDVGSLSYSGRRGDPEVKNHQKKRAKGSIWINIGSHQPQIYHIVYIYIIYIIIYIYIV